MSTPPAEPFDATTLLSAAMALGLRLRNWCFGADDHCFAIYCHLDSYVGTVEAKEDKLVTTGATIADRKTLTALIGEYNERMRLTMRLKKTAPASTER